MIKILKYDNRYHVFYNDLSKDPYVYEDIRYMFEDLAFCLESEVLPDDQKINAEKERS